MYRIGSNKHLLALGSVLLMGLLFHGIADYADLVGRADRGDAGPELPSREVFGSHLVDAVVALLEAPVSPETARVLAG